MKINKISNLFLFRFANSDTILSIIAGQLRDKIKAIKTVIRKNNTREDGTASIYLQYLYDRNHRTFLNTGKRVETTSWDALKGKVKRAHTNAEQLNNYMGSLRNRLEAIIDKFRMFN